VRRAPREPHTDWEYVPAKWDWKSVCHSTAMNASTSSRLLISAAHYYLCCAAMSWHLRLGGRLPPAPDKKECSLFLWSRFAHHLCPTRIAFATGEHLFAAGKMLSLTLYLLRTSLLRGYCREPRNDTTDDKRNESEQKFDVIAACQIANVCTSTARLSSPLEKSILREKARDGLTTHTSLVSRTL